MWCFNTVNYFDVLIKLRGILQGDKAFLLVYNRPLLNVMKIYIGTKIRKVFGFPCSLLRSGQQQKPTHYSILTTLLPTLKITFTGTDWTTMFKERTVSYDPVYPNACFVCIKVQASFLDIPSYDTILCMFTHNKVHSPYWNFYSSLQRIAY